MANMRSTKQSRWAWMGLAAVLTLALVYAAQRALQPAGDVPDRSDKPHAVPRRIISLAPTITEILFALDLGERVVGVTRYCNYPPAADDKPAVGGYYDADFERVMGLRPDLVIMMREHEAAEVACANLDIPFLKVENEGTAKILAAIRAVGKRCGVPERAETLASRLEGRMAELIADSPREDTPRVLICIGREMGSDGIKDVVVAGKGTLYHELVTAVGGQNAYQGPPIQYPTVGREGLLRMRPDIILEMVSDLDKKNITPAQIQAEWRNVDVPAVANARVHVLHEDYVVIPGPRFIHLMEDISKAIGHRP